MNIQLLNMYIDDLQRMLNVVIGFGIFVHQLRLYVIMHKKKINTYRWVRVAFSIIGLYWGCLYTVILIAPPANIFTRAYSSTFVLPAISATLATIFASSLISIKRIRDENK